MKNIREKKIGKRNLCEIKEKCWWINGGKDYQIIILSLKHFYRK